MRPESKGSSKRRLRRFFSSQPLSQVGDIVHLDSREAHHLIKTLRHQVGDQCLLTDGEGREAIAVIESWDESQVSLRIKQFEKSKMVSPGQAQAQIRMFVSLAQRGKMDSIIEKAQELGVYEMIPVISAFTAFKVARDKQTSVLSRWKRIAQEAAKQSGCPHLLKIAPFVDFQSALNLILPDETALLFHPSAQAKSFLSWVKDLSSSKNTLKICGDRKSVV